MKFHPTKDYLLVKTVAQQQTESGLLLVKGQPKPGEVTVTMVFAEVIEAGPEVDKDHHYLTGFAVGEVVAFHPGAAQVINDGVNDQLLVKATAVVARVEDFSTTVSVMG